MELEIQRLIIQRYDQNPGRIKGSAILNDSPYQMLWKSQNESLQSLNHALLRTECHHLYEVKLLLSLIEKIKFRITYIIIVQNVMLWISLNNFMESFLY